MGKATDLDNIKWRAVSLLEYASDDPDPTMDDIKELAELILGLAGIISAANKRNTVPEGLDTDSTLQEK